MKFSGIYLVLSIVFVSMTVLIEAQIPRCLRMEIDHISDGPVWNPPATITKYSYRGQITYLISSDCCDQFDTLYDRSCNHICAPSGGFTGRGDGKCPDFQQNARFRRIIWSEERRSNK